KIEGAFETGLDVDLVVLGVAADEGQLNYLTKGRRAPIFQIVNQGQSLDFVESRRLFDAVISEPIDVGFLLERAVERLSIEAGKNHHDPFEDSQDKIKKRGVSILVVEDNPINQEVTMSLLRNLNYSADLSASGFDALKKCSERAYDIVFMDIEMEGMDGVETTRKIRKDVPEKEQPWIIALTANALGDQRDHYLAEGMNDYLSKPFRSDDLLRVLDKAVGRKYKLEREQGAESEIENGPIDWQTLQELYNIMGKDAAVSMSAFIERFLESMENTLAKIEQCEDPNIRRDLAHGLYGSSMSLGIRCVGLVSKEIEVCEHVDPVKLNELYEKLRAASAEAKALLKDWQSTVH
ncbi:MAG: response regulator, partial [Planctomycetota bacterium]|nr:response regulator [Planctomycetota bacterium]